ncbi:MAG: hypothetical protein PHS34_08690 [Candidatus Omnitrophica bacterium]|nr:hypothetical protein [Candidatus Omnitrophota bacterium]
MTDEQIVLTFYKGRDNRTIARTKTGKICLLDIPYCKENHIWVGSGEDWRCAIKAEKEKVVIVQPITKVLTAEENAQILDVKVKEFKERGFAERTKKSPGKRITSKPL